MLESVTKQNEGRFKLVKVNIDKCPKLAGALNVSSVPQVFLIYRGNLVDHFQGLPKQEELQQFFNEAVLVHEIATKETVMQGLVDKC